jgi:hypothetical protein
LAAVLNSVSTLSPNKDIAQRYARANISMWETIYDLKIWLRLFNKRGWISYTDLLNWINS